MNIYHASDYKQIMNLYRLESGKNKGYQTLMAKACRCQPAFISQILNSHVHITLDQAACLAKFWQLNNDETEYFLALVNLARASSPELKSLLKKKISAIRSAQVQPDHIRTGQHLDLESQLTYYSHWSYAAIHILLTLPSYQNATKIASKLHFEVSMVEKILKILAEMGLIKTHKNRWQTIQDNIHIDRNSPLVNINHNNWRQFVQDRLPRRRDSDTHYSAVYSADPESYELIKGKVAELVKFMSKTVPNARETELYYLGIDSMIVGETEA